MFSFKKLKEDMKRSRDHRDEEIRGKIAQGLEVAIRKSGKSREDVSKLLGIELGTLSKYLNAQMIPGGHVLWRACKELGMVLDEDGLRPTRRRAQRKAPKQVGVDQYELPFVDEVLAGDKVHLTIGKKGSQRDEYVRVTLKIKVAS
jgi:transcriptional regulator with XRE-family HTH domain